VNALNEVIRRRSIDFVFPAHDSVVYTLAKAAGKSELACPVLTSPLDTCEICRSKTRTIRMLQPHVPTPRMYGTIEEIDAFPVFVKPDVGQGSKGTFTAPNESQLRQFLATQSQEMVIQELLPGEEFTVDCFTDSKGRLEFCGARCRSRIVNGISVAASAVDAPELQEFARKINDCLRFRGVWFFEVKLNASGPKLLEVAPRVAGTMAVHRILGINLPLMTLYDFCGYPVTVLRNNCAVDVDRALDIRFRTSLHFSHVYVDLDDCLIVNGRTNADLVAFLVRCINARKTIHLLTRHRRDPCATLRMARLSDLCDSIDVVPEGAPKSSRIGHMDAIFIDDSFQERCDVKKMTGIPVFSSDALLGWCISLE
jgi:biotin carboxylase